MTLLAHGWATACLRHAIFSTRTLACTPPLSYHADSDIYENDMSIYVSMPPLLMTEPRRYFSIFLLRAAIYHYRLPAALPPILPCTLRCRDAS